MFCGTLLFKECDIVEKTAQDIIAEVKERFSDLYDNDDFGTWLAEGSNFDDTRFTVLMEHAVQKVNSSMMWIGSFNVENYPFDIVPFYTALRCALLMECIKHFITSYTEDPDVSSASSPHAVRRDYKSRWESTLSIYKDDFADASRGLNRCLVQSNGIGTKVLVGFSSRYANNPRYRRPTPRTWGGW